MTISVSGVFKQLQLISVSGVFNLYLLVVCLSSYNLNVTVGHFLDILASELFEC